MPDVTNRVVRRGAIAISVAVVLILAATLTAIIRPTAREWVRERMQWTSPDYRVGVPSDLPASLYSTADYTVLIFATTNCDACRRAQPFHQTLLQSIDGHPLRRGHILLTSPSDDASVYAAMLGLRPEQVETIDARGTRVRRVPTILVVDRRGVVKEKAEGVLPDAEQHALLEKVRTLR